MIGQARQKAANPLEEFRNEIKVPLDREQFEDFFNEHLESLDKEMRESFADCELCLKQMYNGYEPHYLALKRGQNEMLGLVLINMDHTY